MSLKGFCRIWAKKGCRRVLLALFGVAALFVIVSGTERALRGSSEFMGFRRIVQVSLVENKNHYEHIGHLRAYPPFFAILWSPFGLFPTGPVPDTDRPLEGTTLGQQIQLAISAALLLVVMTAMTVWTVRCVTAAGPRPTERESTSCAPALLWILCGGLMLNGVLRCETDMLVVMMLAGAMFLMLGRDRQWTGGALLGVAAALKLTPGLFGLYLVCRRNWRALGGMVAAGLICTVVLPAVVWGPEGSVERHRSWISHVIIPYAKEGPESFISRPYRRANQSPKAALVRYLTRYNAGGTRSEKRELTVKDGLIGQGQNDSGPTLNPSTLPLERLGMAVRTLASHEADSRGMPGFKAAVVVALMRGGPAEAADIRLNDLIVRCDGRRVQTVADLGNALAGTEPGETVRLELVRPRYVNVANVSMGTVRKVVTVIKIIILGLLVAAWAIPPAGQGGELKLVLFALVPLGMLLLSDVSHGSHLSLLAIPFGAMVTFCFRRGGQRIASRVSWAVLAAFVLANLIAVRHLKEMSTGTAGMLLLYGVLLYVCFRLHAKTRREQMPDLG